MLFSKPDGEPASPKPESPTSSERNSFWSESTREFQMPDLTDVIAKRLPKDAVILDVGCGYGRSLDKLWEKGYRNLHGVDAAPGMIARTSSKYPHLADKVKVCAGSSTDFADNQFDAVLLISVLTCMHKPKDQLDLLNEVRRVLKPGGILLISDFLLSESEINQERYKRDEGKYDCYGTFELKIKDADVTTICRHYEKNYLDELLATAGFKVQKSSSNNEFVAETGTENNSVHYVCEEKPRLTPDSPSQ